MKHFRHIVFAVLMMYVAVPAWAYDFEVDGIYYYITNDSGPYEVGVSNNGGNSYSGHVCIPNQVYHDGINYAVTSICGNGGNASGIGGAFWNCTDFLSIELPNSIRDMIVRVLLL